MIDISRNKVALLVGALAYFPFSKHSSVRGDILRELISSGIDSAIDLEDEISVLTNEERERFLENWSRRNELSFPSHFEAGVFLAKTVAAGILANKYQPYVGARKIWEIVLSDERNSDEFESLRVFGGLMSEYDDFYDDGNIEFYGKTECLRKQQEIEKSITAHSRKLVDSNVE